KKLIFLPADLAKALKANKIEEAFFNSLSFTNRKEYLDWVVSAKREETRATRVAETIERLAKGWKNPANR
ncbi:MAG: YdeI/OmpD-associated family protein, partial [Flaviaesturariibacter sp.]|nr:YdeI/OmpD-associated family protein [Flaviaesturariibacter sp.]